LSSFMQVLSILYFDFQCKFNPKSVGFQIENSKTIKKKE